MDEYLSCAILGGDFEETSYGLRYYLNLLL